MPMRLLVVTLLFLALPFDARAQFWDGPREIRLSPSHPGAGQSIDALLPVDGCYHSGPSYLPDRTVVTRAGGAITIDLPVYWGITCFAAGDPLMTWTVPVSLGTLAAGSYTVTARYSLVDLPTAPPLPELTRTFVVAGDAAVPAPLGNPAGMMVLGGILLMLGVRTLRARQRSET